MTERERLIELLNDKTRPWNYLLCPANIRSLADYLLENGVILPPCKVGDTLQDVVHCKDCKYLMFSECYGECSKAIKGIVMPDDFCSYGERRDTNDRQ